MSIYPLTHTHRVLCKCMRTHFKLALSYCCCLLLLPDKIDKERTKEITATSAGLLF